MVAGSLPACIHTVHLYALCVSVYFLVQFAAEMSHLLAASIEMAHLYIGCTYVLVTKGACMLCVCVCLVIELLCCCVHMHLYPVLPLHRNLRIC